jgi:hypothetical protein
MDWSRHDLGVILAWESLLLHPVGNRLWWWSTILLILVAATAGLPRLTRWPHGALLFVAPRLEFMDARAKVIEGGLRGGISMENNMAVVVARFLGYLDGGEQVVRDPRVDGVVLASPRSCSRGQARGYYVIQDIACLRRFFWAKAQCLNANGNDVHGCHNPLGGRGAPLWLPSAR